MKKLKNMIQELRRYIYYRKVQKHITLKKAISVLNEKNFFLITSTGRTATTLFAKLFNSLDGFYVVHEPLGRFELRYHRKSLEDPSFSRKFISSFRLQEIAYRVLETDCVRAGEVNPGLRRNLEDIKHFLPTMKIVHIVRDPRDFVTSALNRETFLEGNEYFNMTPLNDIIDSRKWQKMNRFEKICAYWTYENEYMRLHSDVTVKFKKLMTDYEYFKSKLLDILGIDLDYETWADAMGSKVNANENILPETLFENWTDNQKNIFIEICGDEMQACGYSLNR